MKNDQFQYSNHEFLDEIWKEKMSSEFFIVCFIFMTNAEIFMHPFSFAQKGSYSYHESIVAKGNILLLPLLIEVLLAYKTC